MGPSQPALTDSNLGNQFRLVTEHPGSQQRDHRVATEHSPSALALKFSLPPSLFLPLESIPAKFGIEQHLKVPVEKPPSILKRLVRRLLRSKANWLR